MTQIILIILGIVIIIIVLTKKTREKVVGICATAVGLDAQKRENKEKIIALLGEPIDSAQSKRELSNSDIREVLGVSASSVARYMDELEEESKVEQVGNTGRGVVYRLK